MNSTSILSLTLGVGMLAAGASAQVGDPMPDVKFEAFGNTEAASIDDFRGRLILLEVFAYW